MIEIIYDHRMPLRDSAIRHFIIHKWAIILLSHFLSFYFNINVQKKLSVQCTGAFYMQTAIYLCCLHQLQTESAS